jgi:hypothetical protein
MHSKSRRSVCQCSHKLVAFCMCFICYRNLSWQMLHCHSIVVDATCHLPGACILQSGAANASQLLTWVGGRSVSSAKSFRYKLHDHHSHS